MSKQIILTLEREEFDILASVVAEVFCTNPTIKVLARAVIQANEVFIPSLFDKLNEHIDGLIGEMEHDILRQAKPKDGPNVS